MNRRVEVSTPLPPGTLLFRSMHGEEGLSTLFEFDVDMVSESAQLDLKQLLSQTITLRVDRGSTPPRFLSGQVVRCKLAGRATPTSGEPTMCVRLFSATNARAAVAKS